MRVTVLAPPLAPSKPWSACSSRRCRPARLPRPLRVVPKDAYFAAIQDSRRRVQVGLYRWVPDYPSPRTCCESLRCDAFRPALPGPEQQPLGVLRPPRRPPRAARLPAARRRRPRRRAVGRGRQADHRPGRHRCRCSTPIRSRSSLAGSRNFQYSQQGGVLSTSCGCTEAPRRQPADHVKRVSARGGASPPGRRPRRTSTTGAVALRAIVDAGGAQAFAREAIREPDDDQRGAARRRRDDPGRARGDEHRLGA